MVKTATSSILADIDLEFMGSIVLGAIVVGALWLLAV